MALAALLMALGLSVAVAKPTDAEAEPADETVILQLRLWQRISDAEELWLSLRRADGRWDELGTIPITPSRTTGPSYSPRAEYPVTAQFGNVTVSYGGPGIHPGRHRIFRVTFPQLALLRIWQREHDPHLIWVETDRGPYERPYSIWWSPLGLTPLALDDGYSPHGHYRYGDLQVAVPSNWNWGLRADRTYLLALRDVLVGDGAELDWHVGRPASEWEGVRVSGSPRRVTGLDLSDHGLTGEIWGWLGELDALTDLRLDGNSLTGMIPSKLALLTKLKLLRLSGNPLSSCIPPSLSNVNEHDLDQLDLPVCPKPTYLSRRSYTKILESSYLPPGRYVVERISISLCQFCGLFFDVPPEQSLSVSYSCLSDEVEMDQDDVWTAWERACGLGLHSATDNDTWVFVEAHYGADVERSHYSGCVYNCSSQRSPAALIEQWAASTQVANVLTNKRELWP